MPHAWMKLSVVMTVKSECSYTFPECSSTDYQVPGKLGCSRLYVRGYSYVHSNVVPSFHSQEQNTLPISINLVHVFLIATVCQSCYCIFLPVSCCSKQRCVLPFVSSMNISTTGRGNIFTVNTYLSVCE